MIWNRRREEELDRDIAEHIAMETEEFMARGMSPEEARYAALRKFGNVALVKEDTRAVWGWAAVERIFADVRYAIRGMRRNPALAVAAIVTLALGIGVTTAVFSVVDAVVMRQLQFPEAARVMTLLSVGNDGIPFRPLDFAY